jgi:hypothetical protein
MPSSLAPHGEAMASELRRLHPIISWFSDCGSPRKASGLTDLRPELLRATIASERSILGGSARAAGTRCDAAVDRNRGSDSLASFCPPIAATSARPPCESKGNHVEFWLEEGYKTGGSRVCEDFPRTEHKTARKSTNERVFCVIR